MSKINPTFFTEDFHSENQQIFLSLLEEKKVELFVKREDLIHPFVSGNKYRKLKYNLQEATRLQKQTILTFGGAFSNHIVATAVAGAMAGFKTIGIVRGDELGNDLDKTLSTNSTLKEAFNHGMQFKFISRSDYRLKSEDFFLDQLKKEFGDFYLVPEGGSNALAVKGCEEILTHQDNNFNYICSAVGTGGTIAGLINASLNHQEVLGFPALKGSFLKDEIMKFSNEQKKFSLQETYHFGGYGKSTDELIDFINSFKMQTNLLLDPIYTGKMMFGILDLVSKDYFSPGSKILAIHTGGIQGIQGFNKSLEKKHKQTIKI